MSTFVIAVLTFVAVASLVSGVSLFAGTHVGAWVRQRGDANQRAMQELYIFDVRSRDVMIIAALVAAVTAAMIGLMTGSVLIGIAAGIGALFGPNLVFANLRATRRKNFDERLPVALDQLASSAKAGLSLAQAMEEVAKNAPPPVSEEFAMMVQEHKLGSDLAEAINSARDRLDSQTFGLVATALIVNREKGGNLPQALETMSNSLKEIWRLEQKIITASAEGRKAVWVISAVPLFVFFMVIGLQPDLAESLVGSFAGLAILFAAAALYALGLFWLFRILRMDV